MIGEKIGYGSVLSRLDREGLIEFTADIVRINSVFDSEVEGANESGVTEFVYDFLEREGFEVYKDEVVPGRTNVIAYLRGSEEGKTILFEGHQDVVSVGDIKKWKYDPFGAEIVEVNGKKRMYGRGTNDTKGNTAAAIFAAKAIKDAKLDFKGNIMLCIPVDEEGMMIGIRDFIKKGWADNVDAAVICEPEEKKLCIYQKGALRIQIEFYGKMAHGAMPLSGNNPNWSLGKVINELRKLENFEKDRIGKHEYVGEFSITPTMIKSPINGIAQLNVIPDDCLVTLDIRTVPGQEHDAIVRQIQGILDRYEKRFNDGDEKFKATLKVIDDRPWTYTSKEEPVVKAIAKAHRTVMKEEPVYAGVPGATDGTFLSALKDIPVIVTGAGDIHVPHQVDEWIELDDLIEITEMYILTSMYYLNGDY